MEQTEGEIPEGKRKREDGVNQMNRMGLRTSVAERAYRIPDRVWAKDFSICHEVDIEERARNFSNHCIQALLQASVDVEKETISTTQKE